MEQKAWRTEHTEWTEGIGPLFLCYNMAKYGKLWLVSVIL